MSFTLRGTAGEGGSQRTRSPARGPARPRRRDARFGGVAPAGRAGARPLRPHRRAERALRGGGRLGERRARRVSLGRRGGGRGDARRCPLDVLARHVRRGRGRGVFPARTPDLRRVGTRRDARRAPRGARMRNTSVRARRDAATARGARRRRRKRILPRAFFFRSFVFGSLGCERKRDENACARVGEDRPREVRREGDVRGLDERRARVRVGDDRRRDRSVARRAKASFDDERFEK